jgi:hypothetical protein
MSSSVLTQVTTHFCTNTVHCEKTCLVLVWTRKLTIQAHYLEYSTALHSTVLHFCYAVDHRGVLYGRRVACTILYFQQYCYTLSPLRCLPSLWIQRYAVRETRGRIGFFFNLHRVGITVMKPSQSSDVR